MGSRVLTFTLALAFAPLSTAQLLPADAWIQRAAVDSNGSIYLGGSLTGRDLSTSPDVVHSGCTKCRPGFLVKLAPSGDRIVWATYLDGISALVAAPDGSIYAAGSAAPDVTLPPLSGYRATPASLYVVRLSSDGRQLLAGTWFGGNNVPTATLLQGPFTDSISAMKLDAAGNVYVVGGAVSSDFPVSPGADHRNDLTPPNTWCAGAAQFVAKLDPSLSKLFLSARVASTNYTESASDLAVGRDGTLYLSGTMGRERGQCPAWPVLTRLSADGLAMIYAAVVGERSPQGGYAVAVDADGSAYLAGDDRMWPAEPAGWVEKFDAQGARAGSRDLNGFVDSLAIGGDGDLVALGHAWPGRLSITPGGLGACRDLAHEGDDYVPYVARLNRSSLESSYAGYLPSDSFAHLSAPESVVVQHPYSTMQPFAVVFAGPPPAGTVTCIANAANYTAYGVAPGEIVTLFGNRIGPNQPASLQFDASGKVTTQLAGVGVTAGGLPAPILYAGPDQINLVLPFGLKPASPYGAVRMEVLRDGAPIASFDKLLADTAPGAFSAGGSPWGFLAALNQNGSVNSPANPAAAGEAVSIFVTGLGAETPQPADGARPPLPATKPVLEATAYVGLQPADIEYIGNAPTLVEGLVQINIRLPDPLPTFSPGQAPGTAYIRIGLAPFPPTATFGGYIAVR